MAPEVTVFTPAYNQQLYLHDTIQSVVRQTFTDFEYIIIDDGSTDASGRIINEYAKQDPRIRASVHENRGIVRSCNEGIEASRGRFFARIDGDDIWLPEHLAKQMAFMRLHPECVAVGCRSLLIDAEGWPLCITEANTTHEAIDTAHMNRRPGAIVHSTVLFRREAMLQVGCYHPECELAEDYDIFLRLAEIGRLASLPDVLVKYRQHLKMVSSTRHARQQQAATRALENAYERRGLTMPAHLRQTRVPPKLSIADQHRRWAWWALGAGNMATARKHALTALRYEPFTIRSYKLVIRAMAGITWGWRKPTTVNQQP